MNIYKNLIPSKEYINYALFQQVMSIKDPKRFGFPDGFKPKTQLEKIVINNLVRNNSLKLVNGEVRN